jgi:hypothetical protein
MRSNNMRRWFRRFAIALVPGMAVALAAAVSASASTEYYIYDYCGSFMFNNGAGNDIAFNSYATTWEVVNETGGHYELSMDNGDYCIKADASGAITAQLCQATNAWEEWKNQAGPGGSVYRINIQATAEAPSGVTVILSVDDYFGANGCIAGSSQNYATLVNLGGTYPQNEYSFSEVA